MSDNSLKTSDEVIGLIRAGRAAIRVGDYEAARATFERALAIDPDNEDARDGLRDAQRRLGMEARLGAEEVTHCYRHPDVETALHCTSCSRPICARCSKPAAVGQLCPECVRGRRAPNYQVGTLSLIKGGLVGLLVSTLVAMLIGMLSRGIGFFLFFIIFLIAPAVAESIVRAVDWATRSKRGQPMQITVGVAMVLGGLIAIFSGFAHPLAVLLFLVVGVSTAVARLR
jgi:hypothetical protein